MTVLLAFLRSGEEFFDLPDVISDLLQDVLWVNFWFFNISVRGPFPSIIQISEQVGNISHAGIARKSSSGFCLGPMISSEILIGMGRRSYDGILQCIEAPNKDLIVVVRILLSFLILHLRSLESILC